VTIERNGKDTIPRNVSPRFESTGVVIPKIWYETADRVNRAFTRLLVFSDRGKFHLYPDRIIYSGRKLKIEMNNIQMISLHNPGFATKWVPYIRIDHIDNSGVLRIDFFMRGAWTIFTASKETKRLCEYLYNRYYPMIHRNRSWYPQYPLL
jgi:hypothetical protein